MTNSGREPAPHARANSHALIDELLTTREAAALLRRKEITLKKWRQKGGGPRYVKHYRSVLYRRSDLLKWVDAHVVENTAQHRDSEAA